jgi:hypothetical protein
MYAPSGGRLRAASRCLTVSTSEWPIEWTTCHIDWITRGLAWADLSATGGDFHAVRARAWAEMVQAERAFRLAAERHAEESLQAARANADAALRNVRARTLRQSTRCLGSGRPGVRRTSSSSRDGPASDDPHRPSSHDDPPGPLALVPRRWWRDWALRTLREFGRLREAVAG